MGIKKEIENTKNDSESDHESDSDDELSSTKREKKTEAIMSMPTTTISNEQNLIAKREEMKGGEHGQSMQGSPKDTKGKNKRRGRRRRTPKNASSCFQFY